MSNNYHTAQLHGSKEYLHKSDMFPSVASSAVYTLLVPIINV